MKKQVKLTLDEELWKKLDKEAKKEGLSLASYLRQLLYLQLNANQKKTKVSEKTLHQMADLL